VSFFRFPFFLELTYPSFSFLFQIWGTTLARPLRIMQLPTCCSTSLPPPRGYFGDKRITNFHSSELRFSGEEISPLFPPDKTYTINRTLPATQARRDTNTLPPSFLATRFVSSPPYTNSTPSSPGLFGKNTYRHYYLFLYSVGGGVGSIFFALRFRA